MNILRGKKILSQFDLPPEYLFIQYDSVLQLNIYRSKSKIIAFSTINRTRVFDPTILKQLSIPYIKKNSKQNRHTHIIRNLDDFELYRQHHPELHRDLDMKDEESKKQLICYTDHTGHQFIFNAITRERITKNQL